MNVLVTGAAGFIGSAVCLELLNRGHQVTALDALTYAGKKENLPPDARFLHHDLTFPLSAVGVEAIVHCAAETHVDRSFERIKEFVGANVDGTLGILEYARAWKVKRFVHVSTDEVFGESSTPREVHDRLSPSNPYAATKAGAEYLVRSYYRCFGTPAITARLCNIFGPRQHPEKFIPGLIGRLLRDEEVVVHTGPDGEPGRRRWAHVTEAARALADLAEGVVGAPGETLHVMDDAGRGYDNLQVALMVANLVGRPLNYRLERSPRLAYDADYSLKPSAEAYRWRATESFEKLLQQTVAWYLARPERV